MKKPNGEYYSFQEWDEFLQNLPDQDLVQVETEMNEDLDYIQRKLVSDRLQGELENTPTSLRIFELLKTQLGMLQDEQVRRSGKAV